MTELDHAALGADPTDQRRAEHRRTRAESQQAMHFAVESARLLHDSHCTDVIVLDTRDVSQVTDFIVIATGTSDRQIRSVGDDVAELGKPLGFGRYGTEQDPRATWVVVDFVDVIVHLFEPATRAHYDLEMLWGDVPRIEWQRTRGDRNES
jgi:ribosome-associated protein